MSAVLHNQQKEQALLAWLYLRSKLTSHSYIESNGSFCYFLQTFYHFLSLLYILLKWKFVQPGRPIHAASSETMSLNSSVIVEYLILKPWALSVAIAASTLLVSDFPPDFETWLQGSAPIQSQEHLAHSQHFN